jgi:ATP-dependent Clp protease protease subunit
MDSHSLGHILDSQNTYGLEARQASDIEISAKRILKNRETLNKILAKNTGQSLSKIEKDVDRDFFMDPEEAKKYGIIDKVMEKKA